MNRLFLLLIMILQFSSCSGQEVYYGNKYYQQNINPTEWFDGINPKRLLNLKGEISQIKHLAFKPNAMDSSKLKLNRGTNSYILKFNDSGQIIEESGINRKENIANTTSYLNFFDRQVKSLKYYDKNQNIKSSEISLKGENNVEIGKEIFNGESTITEDYFVNQIDDTLWTKNRFYDMIYVNGHLISQISFNGNDKWLYQYYPNGNRKYKGTFEKDLPKIEEMYDDSGRLTARTHFYYDPQDVVNETSKYMHQYEDGNKTTTEELHTINENTHVTTLRYAYDKFNKLESINKTFLNRTDKISHVNYNENGDITERQYDNEITEFRNYKYDRYGNWTEREEWINNKFYYKYQRTIQYK